MSTARPCRRPRRPAPPGAGRGEAAGVLPRGGYTLVELLVSVSIVLVLLALLGGAISAARSSANGQRTKATITAIDGIIRRHYETCETRASSNVTASGRGAAVRQQVTADMPDTWADVQRLPAEPFNRPRHFGYRATYDALKPTADYEDAECLFMALMQGGLADCVTCSSLSMARKGDKDNDGAQEFWDEWGEPIRYVLWPAGFEFPPGSGTKLFSTALPFESGTTVGLVMRPLVFSAGPDKLGSTVMNAGSNLSMGSNCGNPSAAPVNTFGGLAVGDAGDCREDNLTNLDGEVTP